MFRSALQLQTSAIKVTSRSQQCLFSEPVLSIMFFKNKILCYNVQINVSNVIMYKGGAEHGMSVTAITADGKCQYLLLKFQEALY